MYRNCHLLLIMIFCLFALGMSAQEEVGHYQNVHVKAGQILRYNGKEFQYSRDTVIKIDARFNYSLGTSQKTNIRFYDSLRSVASRSRITKELYDLLVVDKGDSLKSKGKPGIKLESSEKRFEPFKGKVIRNIYFKQKPVFSSSDADTSKSQLSWTENAINNIHVNTRQWVLKNNLLIRKGQTVKPYIMAESERILRQTTYLENATIYLMPSQSNDSVDVLVVTQDVFSLGVDFYLAGLGDFDFTLYDENFMGLGHRFETTIDAQTGRAPYINISDVAYKFVNIKGSFIDGEVSYNYVNEKRSFAAHFYRDFFSSTTEYAGGAKVAYTTNNDVIYEPEIKKEQIAYLNLDAWAGKSYRPDSWGLSSGLTATAGINSLHYTKRPDFNQQILAVYRNSIQYLASLTAFQNKYYTGRYFRRFGLVEDIPYGRLVSFTFGPDNYESYNRWYTGLKFILANRYKIGYISQNFSVSGYWNHELFEQGMLEYNMSYYSKSRKLGNSVLRNFVRFNYTIGINRQPNEYINVVDEMDINSVRQEDTILFAGTQRFFLEAGAISFTPIDIYGFRLAWFASGALSFIGDNDRPFWQNKDFMKVSTGLQVRNEHLVLKTIQLKISYLPEMPEGFSNFQIEIGGISILNFDQLRPKPPATQRFQ